MIHIEDKSLCSGCHSCYNICPKKCITMQKDKEGFLYPLVNRNKCIECNLCVKHCPILNPTNFKTNEPSCYACYNTNEHIRMMSSSGGIFTLLAEYVINQKGIVFGAAFDNNFNVQHVEIDNINDLSILRGSKYVQSNIGSTYNKVLNYLKCNRLVYFSGTPCQIDGLLSFCGKKYDNLICQDIICHGVPSLSVWEKFLDENRNLYNNQKPLNINFRNKENGWNYYEMHIEYPDNIYKSCFKDNEYMQLFLKNLCLRPSCYNCHSKSLYRNSDITLGDFWGIDNIDKELNDNKGISLIFINSKKGRILFNNIKDKIIFKEVDLDDAIQYNPSSYKSVAKPKKRDDFFKNIDKNSSIQLLEKYDKFSLKRIIKKTIKKLSIFID